MTLGIMLALQTLTRQRKDLHAMEGAAQNVRALPAVKWIFDASFRYTPSYATDVRKTFERIRREMQFEDRDAASPRKVLGEKVLRLDLRRTT